MDFTLHTYEQLLQALIRDGYTFLAFEDYMRQRNQLPTKYVILRHDVDLKADHSLAIAQLEHRYGARASYYFRIVPQSNQPSVIRAIQALGHEIGYHYEDMAYCNGNVDKAIAHFEEWLTYFREFYPVSTICMHGAPTNKWDGRDLWKKYDYHQWNVIGEPYLDVDFSSVLYLTDTGRRWDGYKVSVRDKIPRYQDEWIARGLVFHSTMDIIRALDEDNKKDDLSRLMLTTHPQRWTNNILQWVYEYLFQTLKNAVKRVLILCRF